MDKQWFQNHLSDVPSFPHWFIIPPVFICAWVWIPAVLLVCHTPFCPDYCSLNFWFLWYENLSFLFLKNILTTLGSFHLRILGSTCLIYKNLCHYFVWDCIKSIDEFEDKWHLNCIEYSNTWTQYVSLFIDLFWSLSSVFTVFSI